MKKNKRLSQASELHIGGPTTESTVCLCLYADDIDIENISSLLGREPTKAHRKGDVIGRRGPFSIGLWSLEAPEALSFAEKVSYLTKSTSPEYCVWDSLAVKHKIQLRCAVFLHSWSEGIDIPAELMCEMGKRHWDYMLSIYSAEGEEILDSFLQRK